MCAEREDARATGPPTDITRQTATQDNTTMPRFAIPILLLFAVIAPASAAGQEPIRFPRSPDISPDGKQVAFSYLGDIWIVEAIGGVARPVTMHEAHDYVPAFSPDGRTLAFSSSRYGSYDVFVVPTIGGKPKRLTFDSGHDIVTGWTPDGKNVVFSSTRSSAYPSQQECYTISVEGGAEKKLNLFEAKEAHFAPVGDKVAFVRGPGTWYRRGYKGSSNDDLYIAAADGSATKQLTTHSGQDTAPMWSKDGKTLFYVTDNGFNKGCSNIVSQSINGLAAEGSPKPVTQHTDDMVRRARLSGNGEWIVYECGGDIWVTSTKSSGPPRKLAIEVHADDKSNTSRTTTFSRDATEFSLSPDETHAVVVVHGQLFLTKVPLGGKSTRLTEHASADHSVSWSPDGKTLLFASDRTGVEELYSLQADDPEHPELTKAHKFKTTQLTKTGEEESAPSFSPKGDRIAYLRGGQLWTMKPDGTDAKVLVDGKKVLDYDWSPDGKYVCYARMDGSFASEVYIVGADGTAKPVNISRYATFNSDVTWGANKIAFVSQRRGNIFAMHVASLQKPAVDGAKTTDEIEWDDIHLRVDRVSATPAEGGSISPDGLMVAFRSLQGGDDLWVAGSNGQNLGRLTSGNQSPRGIKWAKKSSGTVYFLNGAGELRFTRASFGGFTGTGGPVGDPGQVRFACKLTIARDEEFAEMFAQAWRSLSDNFYDKDFHGANWKEVRAKYAPMVSHCASREDLYALISLMLGELNASHLGISGRLPVAEETTADLGLLFDEKFAGPGLKIAEVLKRGPADKRGLNLKAGDIITHIDRVELTPQVNLSKLLNNRVNDAVGLTLAPTTPGDPKSIRKLEISGVDRAKIGALMYDRWVAKNAEQVDKLSGGKLGYIHIPSMDDAGLEAFMRSLYSDNFDKEAIVIDVRNNGGGFTHDMVLNYLVGKDHTRFVQRDGGEGQVLRNFDRKWSKPLTVLINNRSYSDAEIFPHAFRASGLGKVVGQATGGLVIGTGSTRLIDGSQFRIPRIGVFTNKNVNMDKEGVPPDVAVEISPEDWAKGIDTQIAKSVELLTVEVASWKKAKTAHAATIPTTSEPKPVETKPMTGAEIKK